ncbi:CvpA family protein [Ruminococcus sp. AF31-8BH]|uniref:CvpA family protein n=1 Tax=Blautia segnis TaxID=2763030 RepID=A0A8I0DRH4_9FIRM|nr:CvpA family protein [Blautia segnis]NSL05822.1 CvpA family protein [Blautia glucerasea]RGF69410.1 CvpA family protein [Ruminococcus sp. AF31-8BH]HCL08702.1 colicin V production protein [Blautia sp.]
MSWTWLGIAVLALIAAACIMGFRKGFVKEIVSVFFMLISFLLVWAVNPYVNTFVKEYTPVYDTIQDKCQTLVSEQIGNKKTLDKEEQNQVMENMELPDLLKNALVENNTAETYRYLAVSTFTEYISDSLAVMAVNGISFLISFVLSAAVIKLLGFILNVLTKLPVINGINKIAGAAVGGIKCIIFIWIAFLVLTLLCNTTLGQQGMALIQQDAFLNFLYSQNVFVKVFMSVFYGN